MNTLAKEMFRSGRLAACLPGLPDDDLLDLMVGAYQAASILDVDAITEALMTRVKARRGAKQP
ncbi:MAG: hypothetical protein ACOYB3_09830 [Azonexus sp.]|jgi:hypothetical protein